MDELGGRNVATTLGEQFRLVHEGFRKQVEGLDVDALNWTPTEGANSIAVLVTHTLGSESEMLMCLRRLTTNRDRDSEFVGRRFSAADLNRMIDRANTELAEHTGALTAADLTELRPRGERPPKPGLEWLVTNYGHAREHLAQVELTRQLYEASAR